jgi:hypothetical protein
MEDFQIDPIVAIEMHWLQTIAWWDVLMPTPHILHHSHVFIFSLNIKSISLHKNDVCFDYNLKASHILCFNETHFNPQTSNIISFIDLEKHSSIIVYAQNGTMIIYDKLQHYHHMKHLPFRELSLLQQHSIQIQ